jgi:hypothetical protein
MEFTEELAKKIRDADGCKIIKVGLTGKSLSRLRLKAKKDGIGFSTVVRHLVERELVLPLK